MCIHVECCSHDSLEAPTHKVLSLCHCAHDARKNAEIVSFRCVERVPFEERDDFCEKVMTISNSEDNRTVIRTSGVVELQMTAAELPLDRLKYIPARAMLINAKLRNHLPAEACPRCALKRDVERPLTINETCNI